MFSLHLKGLVNHRPLSLLPIPSSATKHLLPTLLSMALSLKHDACLAAVADSSYTKQTFCFGPTGSETQLTLPPPNGAAGGQALSITCARISLALSLPFPPHPHPNLWQYLHHACAGLRCNLSLPLLSFCSFLQRHHRSRCKTQLLRLQVGAVARAGCSSERIKFNGE